MNSRIAANQNEDEVKQLGREYLYLRQLSRPPYDGLEKHQILRMNTLITRLNEIDPTIVPWLSRDRADRRGTAPSQLVLDLDYDPLSGNLTPEQEAREARRCMATVRVLFPGLHQSLKTGEKYCGEGFVERYGCNANQGEEVFDGFCSRKQVDTTAGDDRMILDNTANNARLQSDRGSLHGEAGCATFNQGLALRRQKLTENNNARAVDGNSALQQAPVDLSSSSQIIEHAASTSEQALLLVSSIVPLPDSSTTSAPKQTPTPTLDAKAIPAIPENSPKELQQKLAPTMSTASNSVVLDASVPGTTSNTGESPIISDKPVESPQRTFVNSLTKNASASIGDPSTRPSKLAATSVKQPLLFSTSESSTAMDICEPESMMKIPAAGSAMELSDEEGEIKEDVACLPLMSPASLAQKNNNNISKKHPTKEVDKNINTEPQRKYFSGYDYPSNGPSAYSWGVARHWGARPPPGAYRPDDVVFAAGMTSSGSGPSTSPSRDAANDPPPPPSYPPPPPPPSAASHRIVPRPAAQQPNRSMPASVGGSSISFDHRMQAAIRDPTLSSLPPVPANLPPRPVNRAATPPRAARGLMPGLADPDSPTPSRTPGGKLHRPSRPLSQPQPRPKPSRQSQQVDGPVSIDCNVSLHFEYVIMKMYSRNQRDEAATRLQRLIEDDLAYGLLKIVSLPDDKSIKVSGPQGFRTRDNLARLFPKAKSFAHAAN